jgi:hypothetical protein
MTSEEISKVVEDMIEMFGDSLPDPEHCPRQFQYYIKLYFYEKFVNESNTNTNKPI